MVRYLRATMSNKPSPFEQALADMAAEAVRAAGKTAVKHVRRSKTGKSVKATAALGEQVARAIKDALTDEEGEGEE